MTAEGKTIDWVGKQGASLRRFGMIVPSSNTTLEPVASLVAAALGVQIHVARVSVSILDTSDQSQRQFQLNHFVEASRLLAEAEVDAIAWGGTSGGWLGADWDYAMTDVIYKATGIPATTGLLAQLEAFKHMDMRTIGLVLPYEQALSTRIGDTFSREGCQVAGIRHFNLSLNTDIGRLEPGRLQQAVSEFAGIAEAVSIFCTNFTVALDLEQLEQKHQFVIFDSILLLLWQLARMTGVDTRLSGWGKLFQPFPS